MAGGCPAPLRAPLLMLLSACCTPATAETPAVLLAPLLQCPKDEPESRKYRPAPPRRAARPPPQLKPVPACRDGGARGSSGGLLSLEGPTVVCSLWDARGWGVGTSHPPSLAPNQPCSKRVWGQLGWGRRGGVPGSELASGHGTLQSSGGFGTGCEGWSREHPHPAAHPDGAEAMQDPSLGPCVRAGEGSGCCSPHQQGSGLRGGPGETPPQKQEQRRARCWGSPGCCFVSPPLAPLALGERTPASRPASAPGNYVVSLNSPCSFKWMWDSPSLPALICCVAWPRAATQLLPSSPEVAALQWWVSDSCFCS